VDRRSQNGETGEATPNADAAEQEVLDTEAGAEPEIPADAESAEESSARHGMPPPEMLLGFAAAQLEVFDLVELLIRVFDGHAWQNMGLVAHPMTGEVAKDLPAAQLAIDCVQFLLSKAEPRLTDTERRDAQRRLSDLRMNYLAKVRESG
jgi:hypothetical protein